MTRREGQRVVRFPPPRRALALLWFLVLLPTSGPGMTLGGRLGLEIDGLGEEYTSYGVFDDRIRPDDSIEEQIEKLVRSRETRTLALLHLNLRTQRDCTYLELREIGRLGNGRQRNSLIAETSFVRTDDRFRIENEWHVQGGEEEPTGGSQDFLTLTWDRTSLPWGLRSQARLGADWSRSAQDTLAAIFDYRSTRGQLQLRRDLTARSELRALLGIRRKDAFHSSSGSYTSWFAEGEASGFLHERGQFELSSRAEDRSYREDAGSIPSSREVTAEGRYEYRANRVLRPYADQRFVWQDYAGATDVFQDHWSWTGEVGADLHWMKRPSADPLLDLLETPKARFRVGTKMELFHAIHDPGDSLSQNSTYDSFGAILGVTRETSRSFWADLSLEAGARDYHADGDTTNLAFEGLNLSFSTSDYLYLRATAIIEWAPVTWLRAEGFVQWDEEFHRRGSEDFRLWILNASLTYPF